MDPPTLTTTPLPSTSTSSKTHERKCSSEDGIHYVDDDDGVEFALDSRHLNKVHEELEKLNIATDVINKLELQLDESRMHFRQIHAKWLERLEALSKKNGAAIAKSRPYYEAMAEERTVRSDVQEAAARFERTTSLLHVAKQQVKLTQDSLNRQKAIEPECLEVLNHHVQRVNDVEKERSEAEELFQSLTQRMHAMSTTVRQLERENARAIRKCRHYFDQKREFRHIMDHQKALISRLEQEVKQKKVDYTTSLRALECISDSIHEERSLNGARRGGASPDSARKRLQRQCSTSASVPHHLNCQAPAEPVSQSAEHLPPQVPDSCGSPTNHSSISDELEAIAASVDGYEERPDGLGSGVILLAQQLLRGSGSIQSQSVQNLSEDKRTFGAKKFLSFRSEDAEDVRYHTTPQGISPLSAAADAQVTSPKDSKFRRTVSDMPLQLGQ